MGNILRHAVAASLVWGSFLLTHQLAYLLAFPNAANRAHELSHSGHGWLASAIHVGAPAMLAILIVGLVSIGAKHSGGTTRAGSLGAGAAGLFAFVEVLERAVHTMSTGHSFALNYSVIAIGATSAFVLGSLISIMYFTVQQYVLQNVYSYAQISLNPRDIRISNPRVFSTIKTYLPSPIIAYGSLRGPPLKV